MKLNKFSLLLAAVFSLVSCDSSKLDAKNNVKNLTYFDGQNLNFLSSDSDFDKFMNDFTHRNMRYDDYSSGQFAVGQGTNFAKNYESMALTFQNSVGNVYGENKIDRIYKSLNDIPQNAQGMIYNTSGRDGYKDKEGTNCPHGWPFPTWSDSTENYLDSGLLEAVGTTAFEFNRQNEKQSQNWKVSGGSFNIRSSGYATFSSTSNESLIFYKDDLAALLPFNNGINTKVAPLVEFDMSFNSVNLDDIYIVYKTKSGGNNNWFRTKQSLYSTNPNTQFESFSDRVWVQMYLDSNWDNQIVTAIGIEFLPKQGKNLSVTNGIINYIRPSYDTRQSNGSYQWILALYNYYMYTQNIQKVSLLMPKARKTILFLNHFLNGESGLLDISFFYGHNGIGFTKDESGNILRDPANGIGNGYWDLLAPSKINLEANCFYYQALVAMAKLEKALSDAEIDVDKNQSTIINKVPGDEPVAYDLDYDKLIALSKAVKTNVEKDIKVEKIGDEYVNKGGFWNSETKRFIFGINESNGDIRDNGFVYFNEEAICAGLGTKSQQIDIMKWIDGTRIVESDKSKGSDIYFYEFAPRFSTCDTTYSYSGHGLPTLNWFGQLHDVGICDSWSRQVQNGGAVIAWSYYDILARRKVLGPSNAYARLKQINNWYNKILNSKHDDGYYFYDDYYAAIEEQNENTEFRGIYTVQSAASNGPGSLGLNGEFIESVILIRSLIDSFGGMDGSELNNLVFENYLCPQLTFLQHDNLRYKNASYSLKITEKSFQIFDVKGEIDNETFVTFKFNNCSTNTKVFINDIESSDYVLDGTTVSVKVNFDNVKIYIQ